MSYRGYLKSLGKCIRQVRESLKEDAVLSDREYLDYQFKVELIKVAKGKGIGFKNIISYIKDTDCRVARMYACYFEEIVRIDEDGYSYSDVIDFFKRLFLESWVLGISNGRYIMQFEDKNGVLLMTMVRDGYSEAFFEVDSKETCIECLISILSFIGCDTIREQGLKDFYEEYLFQEYLRVINDEPAVVYVERSREFKMIDVGASKKKPKKSSNIIDFKSRVG